MTVLENQMDAERIMQLRNFSLRVEIPVASSVLVEEERENEEDVDEEEDILNVNILTDVDEA